MENLILKEWKQTFTIEQHVTETKATTTVKGNGDLLFSQTVDKLTFQNRAAQTFVDEFINHMLFQSRQKSPGNTGKIVGYGGYTFEFIPKIGGKGLNLKQKFFHFLLKHLFLKGKSASIVDVKGLYVKRKSNFR